MSTFLSEEWFAAVGAALAGAPPMGDVTTTVQYVVGGSPEGKVTFNAGITNGVISSLELGKHTHPAVVLSCSYDTALAVISGIETTDGAFMTGALKVEGDHAGWLLDLRPVREAALTLIRPLTDS